MISAAELRELASRRMKDASAGCACRPVQMPAWESITEERWPAALEQVGTLRPEDAGEQTYEEFHPNGTRYGSADAPIAVAWFPFNRSDVFACRRCRSVFLRYTEYGGYYVDHRVRLVDPDLVV